MPSRGFVAAHPALAQIHPQTRNDGETTGDTEGHVRRRPLSRSPMPTIDLTDAELAAVTAAIRPAVEDDRFPRAPAPRPSPLGQAATPTAQNPQRPPTGLLTGTNAQ
jgi:hypothetical protein